MNNKDRMTP